MLGAVFVLAYVALAAAITSLVGTLFGFVPALGVSVLLIACLFILVGGGITRMNAPPRRPAPSEAPTTPSE